MTTFTLLAVGTEIGSQASRVEIPWLRIALAFLFCIALAVGAITLLRLRQGQWTLPHWGRDWVGRLRDKRAGPARLSVVERVALSPGHQVILLRCDDKCHLIHLGPQGSALIATVSAETGPL